MLNVKNVIPSPRNISFTVLLIVINFEDIRPYFAYFPGHYSGLWSCSCSLLAEQRIFLLYFLSLLVYILQETSSPGLELKIFFRVCGLCFCSLITETNDVGLTYVLSSSVFKVQEISSPGLKPKTVFHGCGLCFSNTPAEINTFVLALLFWRPGTLIRGRLWSYVVCCLDSWVRILHVAGIFLSFFSCVIL
jgi:hypothetical protein